MKNTLFLLTLLLLSLNIFGQEETFTSRKGSKFFPGHLDMVVTINNNQLKYELFDHWYSGSYANLRTIEIPVNEISKFNAANDSIQIEIKKNSVHITDKKYRLNKNIRNRNLCATLETMRKKSYAYKVSSANNIGHFALFSYEDLKLPETEFYEKVDQNLIKLNEAKKQLPTKTAD